VHYLVQTHYSPQRRPLRRCHARDLLAQIKNYCAYYGRPMELRPDLLDRVVKSYFTTVAPPVAVASRATNLTAMQQTQLRSDNRNSMPVAANQTPPPGSMIGPSL
jgi:hypothetical protein